MIDRYEMLTGDRISKQLLEYHSAGFCGVNGFLMWGLAYDTTLDQDYIAYMHYSVATTRWAIKAIAEHMGLTLTEPRSEEHTSELQSLMRLSLAVFCLKKNKDHNQNIHNN